GSRKRRHSRPGQLPDYRSHVGHGPDDIPGGRIPGRAGARRRRAEVQAAAGGVRQPPRHPLADRTRLRPRRPKMQQESTVALADRRWPDAGWTRVPYWVYSDPAIYQQELDTFFYGPGWNYVALKCEVPEKGSYKRSWIGERQVVVVRGEEDQIHVWENRCAHRGARLCWKNKGKEESFTCPYHQWNFALDGALQGVPLKRGVLRKGGMPADFDNAQHSLKRLHVHVEGGSIWASFHEDPPSFEDYSGPEVMRNLQRQFPGKKLRLLGYNRQKIDSNWKLYFENLKDPYHATLLHSFLITFGLWRADTQSESIPSASGHSTMVSRNVGKKKSEAAAEITRFKEALELHD